MLGFEDISLTLNANGTGSITCYEPTDSWTLEYVYAGAATGGNYNSQTGRIRGARNNLSGGYPVWMAAQGKRSIKWTFNDEGEITITPVGAATVTLKEGVYPPDESIQYFENEAQKRALDNQHRSDFKNVNEEARKQRKWKKDGCKEDMNELPQMTFKQLYSTSKGILVEVNGDNKFFTVKQDGETDKMADLYAKLYQLEISTYRRRTHGIKVMYENMVDGIKIAIAENHDYFTYEPQYAVININPVARTGYIAYIASNKLWGCYFTMLPDYSLDIETLKANATDVSGIPEKLERIRSLTRKSWLTKKLKP